MKEKYLEMSSGSASDFIKLSEWFLPTTVSYPCSRYKKKKKILEWQYSPGQRNSFLFPFKDY